MNNKVSISILPLARHLVDRFRELILYGLIGAGCAALDFIVYFLILNSLGSAHVLLANCFGVSCGIITSFALNRKYNFKITDKPAIRFVKFFSIGMLGLIISSSLLVLFINRLGYNELVSKLATICVVSIIQFLLNKTVTFKESK